MGRIIDRRRVMGGESLPYDAKIEYLESTGTQWIDTGFNFKGSSKIEISFTGLAKGNLAVYGGDNGNAWNTGEFALFWINDKFDMIIPNSNTSSTIPRKYDYTTNIVYNISVDKTSCVINGTTYNHNMYAEYYCNRTLYLYGTNRGNSSLTYPAPIKLYLCKIFDDGTLVRDFIPVRVGNIGYMYDKVSKQLFGNAGTGAFILGPDK